MEDNLRRALILEEMAAAGLDCLLCLLPENVLLLTGYWPLSSFAAVAYPAQGDPALLVVDLERDGVDDCLVQDIRTFQWGPVAAGDPASNIERHLRDLAPGLGLPPGARIGYEGGLEMVAPGYSAGEVRHVSLTSVRRMAAALGDGELVDATPALMRARRLKTPREVAALRRTHAVAEIGLRWFRDHLVAGMRESELAAGVEAAVQSGAGTVEGVRHGRAWALVMSGPRTLKAWSPFPETSERRVERGDLVVLELAVVVDGFWADLTRTRTVGRSNELQRAAYETLLAAHRSGMAAARPGATGGDVDAAVRRTVAEAGWGEGFMHVTGHGLGFRYHEPYPMLAPGWDAPLEAGMVTSLEPGIYLERLGGGMRREEDVLITESGAEYLSTFDHDLD